MSAQLAQCVCAFCCCRASSGRGSSTGMQETIPKAMICVLKRAYNISRFLYCSLFPLCTRCHFADLSLLLLLLSCVSLSNSHKYTCMWALNIPRLIFSICVWNETIARKKLVSHFFMNDDKNSCASPSLETHRHTRTLCNVYQYTPAVTRHIHRKLYRFPRGDYILKKTP